MSTTHLELFNQIEDELNSSDYKPYLQGEVVRALRDIHSAAVDHANTNANEELLQAVDILEDAALETDSYDFEERMELRNHFEVIRETLKLAIAAEAWGRENYSEDDEDPTEIAVPVIVADEFYEPLFEAVGIFLEENPKPLPMK